ncbi:MAG: hypothetical protein AVDCRST_MAG93-1754, partial [uncultured Chloroflexia bacterium]
CRDGVYDGVSVSIRLQEVVSWPRRCKSGLQPVPSRLSLRLSCCFSKCPWLGKINPPSSAL